MTQEERLIEIKRMLKQQHHLTTKMIANHFNVAFDTARRDVLRLTSTGQAVRVHGGLMEIDQNDFPDFTMRSQILSPVKEKMARVARRFIHPGQFDYIAPSTTLRQLCRIIGKTELSIVTNSIDNAYALINAPQAEIKLLGGILDKKDHFVASNSAIAELNQLHFTTAFIGTSKVRSDGIYTVKQADADIISTVVKRANRVVLIAEKYKFTNQNSSPYLSAPLDKIDVVITDTPLSEERRKYFRSNTQIISVSRRNNDVQTIQKDLRS